jgi:endonuclease YncB( thermonuclease family)
MKRTRIGSFRTPGDRRHYLERYDVLLAQCWPVDHDELDVELVEDGLEDGAAPRGQHRDAHGGRR